MKSLKFILLLAVFVIVNAQGYEDFAVSTAIVGVLKGHFAVKEPKVDLHFYGPKSEALAEKVLREKPLDVSIRVFQLGNDKIFPIEHPSVLLFDSTNHFEEIQSQIAWLPLNSTRKNRLIYVPTNSKSELVALLAGRNAARDTESYIDKVNDTTIDLISSDKFGPGRCKEYTHKTINQFTTETMKWQNETFFLETARNFYGCPINVIVAVDNRFAKNVTQQMFAVVAHQLNFKAVRVPFAGVSENDIDFFDFLENIRLWKGVDFSPALYTEYVSFTVPAGEPYTQLEKMFLMFDMETWICIGVTLAATVLVIRIINLMSIHVQNFVFGRHNTTPTMNAADIFLNGGQVQTPNRNFARFLMMMFIIWSLIIRTCYQSILYANLQNDMRRPRIRSIDEFNENNFTLTITPGMDVLFKESVNRIGLKMNVKQALSFTTLAEYQNKVTMLMFRKTFEAKMSKVLNKAPSVQLLDENSEMVFISMLVPKGNAYTELLFEKIGQMIASGLIQKMKTDFSDTSKKKEEEQEPQILTMDHLGVCFGIILVCLGLSCVAFVIECAIEFFCRRFAKARVKRTEPASFACNEKKMKKVLAEFPAKELTPTKLQAAKTSFRRTSLVIKFLSESLTNQPAQDQIKDLNLLSSIPSP